MLTSQGKQTIITIISEAQFALRAKRKTLSTKSDNEWNAKAQMFFAQEHLDAAKRNLSRPDDSSELIVAMEKAK